MGWVGLQCFLWRATTKGQPSAICRTPNAVPQLLTTTILEQAVLNHQSEEGTASSTSALLATHLWGFLQPIPSHNRIQKVLQQLQSPLRYRRTILHLRLCTQANGSVQNSVCLCLSLYVHSPSLSLSVCVCVWVWVCLYVRVQLCVFLCVRVWQRAPRWGPGTGSSSGPARGCSPGRGLRVVPRAAGSHRWGCRGPWVGAEGGCCHWGGSWRAGGQKRWDFFLLRGAALKFLFDSEHFDDT